MEHVPLTIACGPNEHLEPLRNGVVRPEGIDLTYQIVEPVTLLVDRMVKNQEYDISEMFLALYLSQRAQGQFPFVAIPIFPSRVFRHSFIFVNTNAAGAAGMGGLGLSQASSGEQVDVFGCW